jgi:signal transduction histidine kinase
MSPIRDAVDGAIPDNVPGKRGTPAPAPPDARLIQQLHDGPSQWMALALLHLDSALGYGRMVDARLLGNVRELLSEALRSTRCVLDDWCDGGDWTPVPLRAGLLDLARRISALTGLELQVDCRHDVVEPPAATVALVLHVAQELLLNTCKHAPGASAMLALQPRGAGFELEVADDGPGFDPVAAYRRHAVVGGLGLGGVSDRVARAGGAFRMASRPGRGVRATIRWPAGGAAAAVVGSGSDAS